MSRRLTPGRSPSNFRPFFLLFQSLCLLSLAGCATALKRESQCLISLTVDVAQAQEEITTLETAWHETLVRRDVAVHSAAAASDARLRVGLGTSTGLQGLNLWMAGWQDNPAVEAARLATRRSYERLVEAKARHRPLLSMYDQVMQRVRTRTEEETILSEVRSIMLAGPASFIFYPLVRWNVRSILWDGQDPDAATDTITRFCGSRLVGESQRSDPVARPRPMEGEATNSAQQPPDPAPRLPPG